MVSARLRLKDPLRAAMTSNFARDLETRYELFAAHLGKVVFHWDQANSDDYAKGIQHLPAFLSLTADAGIAAEFSHFTVEPP